MLEVCGFVFSVVQAADIARALFSQLYQYFEAVHGAPKRSRELRQEMGTICDLLESLETILITPDTGSSFTVSVSLQSSIREFHAMLTDMESRVKASQTKGARRFKWPFTKEENDRLLSRMERYKQSLSMALEIKNA
jgi:hypothetical protein